MLITLLQKVQKQVQAFLFSMTRSLPTPSPVFTVDDLTVPWGLLPSSEQDSVYLGVTALPAQSVWTLLSPRDGFGRLLPFQKCHRPSSWGLRATQLSVSHNGFD